MQVWASFLRNEREVAPSPLYIRPRHKWRSWIYHSPPTTLSKFALRAIFHRSRDIPYCWGVFEIPAAFSFIGRSILCCPTRQDLR